MSAALRLFIAVELPQEVAAALRRLQGELQNEGVDARWVRPENIHLTLKFLGDAAPERVPAIAAALQAEAARHSAFTLETSGIGAFPGVRRARVLWAGLAGAAAGLADLQRGIDAAMAALGFPAETKRFQGHLTLARFKAPGDPGRLEAAVGRRADLAFGAVAVREVVLFRSDLHPAGPVYRALERAPLKAGV
jgi:2'-5' RNA ligase